MDFPLLISIDDKENGVNARGLEAIDCTFEGKGITEQDIQKVSDINDFRSFVYSDGVEFLMNGFEACLGYSFRGFYPLLRDYNPLASQFLKISIPSLVDKEEIPSNTNSLFTSGFAVLISMRTASLKCSQFPKFLTTSKRSDNEA